MAYTRAAKATGADTNCGCTGATRRALAGPSKAEDIGCCSCRSDDRLRPFKTAEANRAAYSELSPLSLNVLLRYIIVCSLFDACKSVAKAHNITTVQLRSYNPRIDRGCYNFNRTIGTEICMDEPANKYHAPSSAIEFTSPTTVPEPAASTTRSRKAIPAIPSSKSFLSAERTFSSLIPARLPSMCYREVTFASKWLTSYLAAAPTSSSVSAAAFCLLATWRTTPVRLATCLRSPRSHATVCRTRPTRPC